MYDVLIIGAGLMGAFCARNLAEYDIKIAVVDMNPDVCMGLSRANTSVIYSGCDNKPETLKARLSVLGNSRFEQLSEELDVEFVRCGSLMTACGPKGERTLKRKLEQGVLNGVKGIERISGHDAKQLEPGLTDACTAALWVPTTGTVNPWSLGIAAMENAVQNGAELYLSHEVKKIERTDDGYYVSTSKLDFKTKTVINCSGMAAAKISAMAGDPYFDIEPSKAEYLILDAVLKGRIKHVIFQEPEDGDGVTLVPTTEGSILIGATNSDYDSVMSATTLKGISELKDRALEIMPDIPLELVIRSFAGLRPRARWLKNDTSMDSFYISFRPDSDSFIDLIGMKTPGLTCASEIGKYAAELIIPKLNDSNRNIRKKTDYDPFVERHPHFSKLSDEEKLSLKDTNSAYGRIICRCQNVTEAEVLAAIRMRVGAKTVDGVKRRTGAGLGRCQGGFCTERVIELLAKELKVPFSEIEKDGVGSFIVR